MKLAVFGDIHGNIEALRAAHEAARAQGAESIYHLGDLGGYAPFVNEVVDFMIEHGIRGVQGNYDYNVAHNAEHCGCRYEDPEQARLAQLSFDWTKQHTTAKSRAYMESLPETINVEAGGLRVALFHATPHKNNIYWYEEREGKFFEEMAAKTEADVLIYGHTHKAYRKDISGRVFINSGSVGKPKDKDPRACVTMVDIAEGQVRSEFLRVAYDVVKVADAIRASGLPVEFADKLLKGE